MLLLTTIPLIHLLAKMESRPHTMIWKPVAIVNAARFLTVSGNQLNCSFYFFFFFPFQLLVQFFIISCHKLKIGNCWLPVTTLWLSICIRTCARSMETIQLTLIELWTEVLNLGVMSATQAVKGGTHGKTCCKNS